MAHPDAVKAVLKRAGLSEGSTLNNEQLGRATVIAESKSHTVSGRRLASFIMKGATSEGAGGGRVPGKMSMTEAAKLILGRARGPLHAHEVARRAIDQELIATAGATPEQTMAARLAVGAKKGTFKRTAPNTFTLPAKSGRGGKARRPKPAPVAEQAAA